MPPMTRSWLAVLLFVGCASVPKVAFRGNQRQIVRESTADALDKVLKHVSAQKMTPSESCSYLKSVRPTLGLQNMSSFVDGSGLDEDAAFESIEADICGLASKLDGNTPAQRRQQENAQASMRLAHNLALPRVEAETAFGDLLENIADEEHVGELDALSATYKSLVVQQGDIPCSYRTKFVEFCSSLELHGRELVEVLQKRKRTLERDAAIKADAQKEQQRQVAQERDEREKRKSPNYWAGQFAAGIHSVVTQATAAYDSARQGYAQYARDQLWPRVVSAEDALCDQLEEMKAILSADQVNETITIMYKQVAYQSGDREAAALKSMAVKYVSAPSGSCRQWPDSMGSGRQSNAKR